MTSDEDGLEKETHIVFEIKHEKIDEEKRKLDRYQVINIFLILVNLVIAYQGYSHNLKWQDYQKEITLFEPYTRISISEPIYLDTHDISQGADDNYIFFRGTPEFTITVIAPMPCVLDISEVLFNRSEVSVEKIYETDNDVRIIDPIIEELPAGLSKFTTKIWLQADLRIKENHIPDVGNSRGFRVGYITLIGSLKIIPGKTIQVSEDFPLQVFLSNPLGESFTY